MIEKIKTKKEIFARIKEMREIIKRWILLRNFSNLCKHHPDYDFGGITDNYLTLYFVELSELDEFRWYKFKNWYKIKWVKSQCWWDKKNLYNDVKKVFEDCLNRSYFKKIDGRKFVIDTNGRDFLGLGHLIENILAEYDSLFFKILIPVLSFLITAILWIFGLKLFNFIKSIWNLFL